MIVQRIQEAPHFVFQCRIDPADVLNLRSPKATNYFVATVSDSDSSAFIFLYQELNRSAINRLGNPTAQVEDWQRKYTQMFNAAMPLEVLPPGRYRLFTDENDARMCTALHFHSPLKTRPPASRGQHDVSAVSGQHEVEARLERLKAKLSSVRGQQEVPSLSLLKPSGQHEVSARNLSPLNTPRPLSPVRRASGPRALNQSTVTMEYHSHHEELDNIERTTMMVKLQHALMAAEDDRALIEQQYSKEKSAVHALELKFAALVEKQQKDNKALRDRLAELETAAAVHESERKGWAKHETMIAAETADLKSQLAQRDARAVKGGQEAQLALEKALAEIERLRALAATKERDTALLVEVNVKSQAEAKGEWERRLADLRKDSDEGAAKARREADNAVKCLIQEKLEMVEQMHSLKCEMVEVRRNGATREKLIEHLKKGLTAISKPT